MVSLKANVYLFEKSENVESWLKENLLNTDSDLMVYNQSNNLVGQIFIDDNNTLIIIRQI